MRKPVYLLLLISAALYVGEQVVGVLELVIRSQQFSSANTGAMIGSSVMGVAFSVCIIGALYMVVLIPMMLGHNWGRVVGYVFASLGTLGAILNLVYLIGLPGPLWILNVGVELLFIGVNIAWIVVAAKTWEKPAAAPYPCPPLH
ncbi:hypothetical protein [Kocuria sp. ZOR0020]|uniref:hypothetical protein n=1 Tax=Kocuria sp. ZOR0020 TaxID=1339234 RepID=UPI00064678D0|nr:hypothetical protein [Kocuria sp. ZOR0020]